MVHTLFNEILSSGIKFENRRNMGLYIGKEQLEKINYEPFRIAERSDDCCWGERKNLQSHNPLICLTCSHLWMWPSSYDESFVTVSSTKSSSSEESPNTCFNISTSSSSFSPISLQSHRTLACLCLFCFRVFFSPTRFG